MYCPFQTETKRIADKKRLQMKVRFIAEDGWGVVRGGVGREVRRSRDLMLRRRGQSANEAEQLSCLSAE